MVALICLPSNLAWLLVRGGRVTSWYKAKHGPAWHGPEKCLLQERVAWTVSLRGTPIQTTGVDSAFSQEERL